MESTFLQLTTSALIDAYHNEPVLWDTGRNASEEEKELAWLNYSIPVQVSVSCCEFSQAGMHFLRKL